MFAFALSAFPVLNRAGVRPRLVDPNLRFRTRSRTLVIACTKASREEVQRIANLAQLELSDEEVTKLTPEFQKVIDFFNSMNEVNLDGIEPMSTPNDSRNVTREDKPVLFPDV